jgi:hypothetical protein
MQAYALKSVIESFGHHVTFRDFQNGEPRHKGEKVKPSGLLSKIAKIPNVMRNLDSTLNKRAFRQKFSDSYVATSANLLQVAKVSNFDLSADAMVIGSDEVFNYTQNHAFGYVPCLFGHQINAPLIVSYAPSAGYTNLEDVVTDGMVDEIGAGLRRMSHISVRDENTRALVELCTGSSPTLVIDPTLIYDFDHLIPKERLVRDAYLLVYAYEGRMESNEEISAIKNFAVTHNLKIVSAGSYHEWCDENIVVTPFELLKVFKDAAFVVTDTFHGSIFAMKSAKQFATFLRGDNPLGSNANKVSFLLHQFGMESRIVNDLSQMSDVLTMPAPYKVYEERLITLRNASLDFLKLALA